jgi:hypothetical protein
MLATQPWMFWEIQFPWFWGGFDLVCAAALGFAEAFVEALEVVDLAASLFVGMIDYVHNRWEDLRRQNYELRL